MKDCNCSRGGEPQFCRETMDVQVRNNGGGDFEAVVLTERGAARLTKAGERVFERGESFHMTVVGVFQLTRLSGIKVGMQDKTQGRK
ncbi:MAG TPA: hypothetical protein VJN02_12680 [Gammaproteobacteria bacterium]|nr:hypothetical protein [Gammaproteobacteria bacterium]